MWYDKGKGGQNPPKIGEKIFENSLCDDVLVIYLQGTYFLG